MRPQILAYPRSAIHTRTAHAFSHGRFLNTIINIRGGKRVHACHSRLSQLPMERNLNHDRLYYVRVPFEYLYTCRYLLV